QSLYARKLAANAVKYQDRLTAAVTKRQQDYVAANQQYEDDVAAAETKETNSIQAAGDAFLAIFNYLSPFVASSPLAAATLALAEAVREAAVALAHQTRFQDMQ